MIQWHTGCSNFIIHQPTIGSVAIQRCRACAKPAPLAPASQLCLQFNSARSSRRAMTLDSIATEVLQFPCKCSSTITPSIPVSSHVLACLYTITFLSSNNTPPLDGSRLPEGATWSWFVSQQSPCATSADLSQLASLKTRAHSVNWLQEQSNIRANIAEQLGKGSEPDLELHFPLSKQHVTLQYERVQGARDPAPPLSTCMRNNCGTDFECHLIRRGLRQSTWAWTPQKETEE
mmetsp:Transcript_9261/g.17384  ORF Transcript_9261/g.17384 Transcript_9261/m.17384 type:complete len:233 (-) Transcript_9261:488-1186(-)